MSVKFTPNIQGFDALRNSPEVRSMLLERAKRVANACGSGYVADVQTGKKRAHAMVKTTTAAADKDNKRNNTLLKNLDLAGD